MLATVSHSPIFDAVQGASANGSLAKLFSSPSLNATTIFCGLITGMIGWVAFSYGKKQARISPMVIGIALMAYPYFIANTTLMIVIGVALTAALYVFRE